MGKGTLFSQQEAIYFVKCVRKRESILFGTFSATITFTAKLENWWQISKELVSVGFPECKPDSLKKKWSNLVAEAKEKLRQK